jgi:hypothetical protein
MSHILSILALSTKAMMERPMSEMVYDLYPFLSDYGLEKFLKKLTGKTDVEDALLRLDLLTKEESLMAVANILEVTDRVEGDVKEIKVLTERMKLFPSFFIHVLTVFPAVSQNRNGCVSTFVVIQWYYRWSSKLTHGHREPDARETSNMALSSRLFDQS